MKRINAADNFARTHAGREYQSQKPDMSINPSSQNATTRTESALFYIPT